MVSIEKKSFSLGQHRVDHSPASWGKNFILNWKYLYTAVQNNLCLRLFVNVHSSESTDKKTVFLEAVRWEIVSFSF